MKITLEYSDSSLFVLLSSCNECDDPDLIKNMTLDQPGSENLKSDPEYEGWLIVDKDLVDSKSSGLKSLLSK